MERSAKYRNIGREPKVSFVIDDAVGPGAGTSMPAVPACTQ